MDVPPLPQQPDPNQPQQPPLPGESPQQSPDQQQAVTPTSYLMSQIDETRLSEITEKACQRIEQCRSDMGLSFGVPMARAKSWAYDRQIARVSYAGNFAHRQGHGDVFDECNWTLNIPARFVRFMAAQHAKDLVGTAPFFAAMPEKAQKAKLAKQIEEKIQQESEEAKLSAALAESIRVALIEGERPIKVAYVTDETSFIGPATVAVDEQGQPIKTLQSDYIFPKDDTFPVLVDQNGNVAQVIPDANVTPEQEAQWAQAGLTPQLRLVKDPAFVVTQPFNYQMVEGLEQTLTHKKGMSVDGLFCEDFIYPIFAPSLDLADIQCHCYDERLENLEAKYPGFSRNRLLNTNQAPMAHAGQPINETGEMPGGNAQSGTREFVNVHETYYRCRAKPDDRREAWLFIAIDFQTRQPIYAEYLGNMKMKKPPFRLLRGLQSEPGRAYGHGLYKNFGDKALAIDVWFNRVALKSSKEGSLTFCHEDGVVEVKDGQELVIGGKHIWHIPANSEFGEQRSPVWRKNMNEVSEFEFELLDKLIQSGQMEYGVTSIGELAEAGAPIAKNATATATRNVERTGNTVQDATTDLIAGDIEGILDMFVDVALENMDMEELQYVPGSEELATLNRDEVRGLDRDVRLLLTKARGEEKMAFNAQASQIVEGYYAKPKTIQKEIRSFVVDQLKALSVPDADDKIREPTDDEIKAEQQAQQQAETQRQLRESIQVKLADLAYSERAQALALFGITTAPPNEVAVMNQPPQNVSPMTPQTDQQQPAA